MMQAAEMDDEHSTATSVASQSRRGPGRPRKTNSVTGPGRPRKADETPREEDDPRPAPDADYTRDEFGQVLLPPQVNPEQDVAEPMRWGESQPVSFAEAMLRKASAYKGLQCGISKDWKIVDPSTVNSLPHLFASGPAFTLVFEYGSHQRVTVPKPVRDYVDCAWILGDLAFLVSAVNNEASLDGAEFPTNYVDMDLLGNKGSARVTFTPDNEWCVHSECIDNNVPVDNKALNRLSMFVHFVPVRYTVKYGTNEQKTLQTIFQVAQVIPLPGVDVLKCIETMVNRDRGVCRDIAADLRNAWTKVLKYMLPLHEQQQQHMRRPADKEDGFVKRCFSELTVKANIIEQLERKWNSSTTSSKQRVADVDVLGVPDPGRFRWESLNEERNGELVCIDPALEPSDLTTSERNFLTTFHHEMKQRVAWRLRVDDCEKRKRHSVKSNFPFIPRTWSYNRDVHEGVVGQGVLGQSHSIADARLGHFEGCVAVQLLADCQQVLFAQNKAVMREEFGIFAYPSALTIVVDNTLMWMQQRILMPDGDDDNAVWTDDDLQTSYYGLDAPAGHSLDMRRCTVPEPGMMRSYEEHRLRLFEVMCETILKDTGREASAVARSIRDLTRWNMQVHPTNVVLRYQAFLHQFTDALGILDTLQVLEMCEREDNDRQLLCRLVQNTLLQDVSSPDTPIANSPQYMRAVFMQEANRLAELRDIRSFNLHMLIAIIFSMVGQYMAHNPNWTNIGWAIWVADAGAQWPQERRTANNAPPFQCVWVKKMNSAGIDSVVCAAWDAMCDLVLQMLNLGKARHVHLKFVQCRRCTPAYIRKMGKIEKHSTTTRTGDTKLVVQPPPAELIGVPLRATDMRECQCDMLKALNDANDRDKSSENEILGSTNLNDKGQRVREVSTNLGIGRPITYAHNLQVHCRTCAAEYKTLLQVLWTVPTAPPTKRYNKRKADKFDRESNMMSTEPENISSSDLNTKMVATLCIVPFLAGHVLGMVNLLGGVKYRVGLMQSIVKDFLFDRLHFETAVFWGPNISTESFSRTARCGIARAIFECTIYRFMQNLHRHNDVKGALVSTIATHAFSSCETYNIFDAGFQILKQIFSRHTLVVNTVLAELFEVPCVPFDWLMSWSRGDKVDERSSLRELPHSVAGAPARLYVQARDEDDAEAKLSAEHVNAVRAWLYKCFNENCWMRTRGGRHGMIVPMVTSPRNSENEGLLSEADRIQLQEDVDTQEQTGRHSLRVAFSGHPSDVRSKALDMIAYNLKPFLEKHMNAFNLDSGEVMLELIKGALLQMVNRDERLGCFLFGTDDAHSVHFLRLFASSAMLDTFGCHFKTQRSDDNIMATLTTSTTFSVQEKTACNVAALGVNPMMLIFFRSLTEHVYKALIDTDCTLTTHTPWNYFPDRSKTPISELHVDLVCQKICTEVFRDVARGALAPSGTTVQLACVGPQHMQLRSSRVLGNDLTENHFFRRFRTKISTQVPIAQSPLKHLCPWVEDGLHCTHLVNMLHCYYTKIIQAVQVRDVLASCAPSLFPELTYDLLYGKHYTVLQTGLRSDESDFDLSIGYICMELLRTTVSIGSEMKQGSYTEIMTYLRAKGVLVIPTIDRPSALVKDGSGRHALLHYSKNDASCFDWRRGCYHATRKNSTGLQQTQLSVMETLDTCLEVAAELLVDLEVFKTANPDLSQQLPPLNGRWAIQVKLWYPEDKDQFYDNRIVALVDVVGDSTRVCTVPLRGVLDDGEEPSETRILRNLPGV